MTSSSRAPLKTRWHSRLGVTAWRLPSGLWTSRRLRKGHGPLKIFHFRHLTLQKMLMALCHPKQINRLEVRTAIAFIIGPFLFAIGSLWSITDPNAVALSSATLALGSVFFTAGGWWQLRQAKLAIQILPADIQVWQWCGLRCALTQSMGTVLFNINTYGLLNQSKLRCKVS